MTDIEELRRALAIAGIEQGIGGRWAWTHASGERHPADSPAEAAAALMRSYWLWYESGTRLDPPSPSRAEITRTPTRTPAP